MINVVQFTHLDHDLVEKALAIRKAVFVEEQGVDAMLELDKEEEASHYLLLLGEKPLATARWRETEKGIKLERFAVLPSFRNRGFGEIILKEVLKDVSPLEKPIYLHAQMRAVPFYQRHGFYISGEPFIEAGLTHYLMKYPD